jgi:hypothetical protein
VPGPLVRTVARRLPRLAGLVAVCLVGLFLVARAAVELVMVDPGRPGTYAADWGGPSYLGVVLVHAGPGLVVLVLAAVALRRRQRHRHTPQPPRHGG